MNKRWFFIGLFIILIVILLWYFFCREAAQKRPPTLLTTASGVSTTEFQAFDSILFDAVDLEPRTGYTVQVKNDQGEIVTASHLSTDRYGHIPETVIWYNVGILPCPQVQPIDEVYTSLPDSQFIAPGIQGSSFTLEIRKDETLVRATAFRVADRVLRPVLYAADRRGCPKSGFLIGEEDVWVVGKNFPKGSIVRLWAVPASSDWQDGDPLKDMTKQYDGLNELPPLFELKVDETGFKKLLWPMGLTSLGSYDIVAEVVTYPFGNYRTSPTAEAQDVVSYPSYSGFVIQRRPGAAEPLEMDIAGTVLSPYTFQDTFLTDEDVYVGVDPCLQPDYVGDTANIFIVADKSDAQWTMHVGDPLDLLDDDDVTGTIETITVGGICGNCWKTLAWSDPLLPGTYDVVLDFDGDHRYTPGTDLIDGLDKVGFTVAEVRVDSISFNYAASGAVTIYDDSSGINVTEPEYEENGLVIKPAAYIMSGSYSVQVNFKAVSGINTAEIWAEDGLGGLESAASPETVTFISNSGQGTMTVNSVPNAIGKHTFSWDWKYKNVNGVPSADLDMGTTGEHIVYTLLAVPQDPQAVPWVSTLEIACDLADGFDTAAAAAREIWDDFYYNAGGEYDTVSGASQYTGSTSSNFNLTAFLTNYDTANIGTVNCYDMGKSVVIFANALGCDAVYTYVGPFGYLNCVKPIGKDWANNPFYDSDHHDDNPIVNGDMADDGIWWNDAGRSFFGNHGFTRVGGYIYDASGGQVDIDGDPDFGPPFTAHLLNGYDTWTSLYSSRVIDDIPPYGTGTPTDYSFSVY